ncbi:SMIM5 protein, partial [Polypterus senegalus]
MSWEEGFKKMGQQVLQKLQSLPQSDPLEIAAFLILLTFIATVLVLFILACTYCCCSNSQRRMTTKVKPLHHP